MEKVLETALIFDNVTTDEWASSEKVYSFEADYPSESYNIEVEIDGGTCTTEQLDAWVAAKPLSSTTSKINAKGDIPTIDIPVIITSTLK